MADYSLRPEELLVLGKSGSGKTTFALRYLVNRRDFVARLVFDPTGQMSDRLGVPAAGTMEEMLFSLEDGWTVFNPHVLFPGNLEGAVDWFCQFAFWVASTRRGRKALLIDEVWRYCSPGSIPQSLALCIQTGRVEGLTMVFCSQFPNLLNRSITAELTEIVSFQMDEPNAFEKLHKLRRYEAEVMSLKPGSWLAVNCETGGELRGRVF